MFMEDNTHVFAERVKKNLQEKDAGWPDCGA